MEGTMFIRALVIGMALTASMIVSANPYANWKFDETNGTTVHDCAGTHDGAVYGNPTWTTGKSNGALNFDGNGDYVQVGSNNASPLIPTGSKFTITCWVNPANVSTTQAVYGYYSDNSGAYWAYSLFIASGDFRFIMGNGTTNQSFNDLDAGHNLAAGTWYHLAVVFDGTNIISYVNGQFAKQTAVTLSGTYPKAGTVGTFRELIGGAYGGTSWSYNGKIDDLRVWRRALSGVEVENVFTDINTAGMHFGGTADYITCANSSNFNFGSGDFTITAWFKADPNISNSDHTIAGKNIGESAGGQYNGYRLAYFFNDELMLTVDNGSSYYRVIGTTALTKGQWYHVAAMRNGSYLRIYLNGVLYADSGALLPATGYSLDNSYPFAIGAAVYWGQSHFFNGNIDAVGVYNRALSQAEVCENMCFNALPKSNLVAYYSFDQSDARDDSGNNNTGTLCGATTPSDGIRWSGSDEFEAAWSLLPNFSITALPSSGTVTLTQSNSLTVSDLASVVLDNTNLTVGSHAPYPTNMSDGLPAGAGPFVAANIQPFRLKYFVNELNYCGSHNYEMYEYAVTHGFNSFITPDTTIWSFLPPGTIFQYSASLNYNTWMAGPPLNIAAGRFDLLPSCATIASDLLANNLFPFHNGEQIYMIDMESPGIPLDLSNLQSQTWYVGGLETAYYNGFVNAELAAVDAAHSAGWTDVGIYGWQPWARTWYFDSVNEATMQARWDNYGKYIVTGIPGVAGVDLLYPTVYCFYWSEQHVAYVMQNIDKNVGYVNTLPAPQIKPVRPYYWNQLDAGGDGWRWWGWAPPNQTSAVSGVPITNEDFRAMSTMNFFTGAQGLVLYGWSGTSNQHIPDGDIVAGNTVTVGSGFSGGGGSFNRYDALYFLSADTATVRFQLVQKTQPGLNYGVDADPANGIYDDGNYQYPVYTMAKSDIVQYLRSKSEPVSAMVEGLALVKLFEYTLSHGQPCIDVTAKAQFDQALPIVRRVQFGPYHIIATYDPYWAENPTPRTVTLNNFAGNTGLNVTVTADKQTRLYVVCK